MGQSRAVILVVVGTLSLVFPVALCLVLFMASVHPILDLCATVLATGAWLALLLPP